MIRIKGLTWFRQKIILDDISLEIAGPGISLIIGPNGAGKTTLLKIIAGLIRDYKGEVLIDGKNIRHLKRKELAGHISFQPQSEEFLLPFAVRDILMAGRYPYKRLFSDYDRNDRNIFEKCVDRFNIGDLIDRDINTLSSGEKRKVLIASAYIQDVPVLLFDEPFSNLDPEGIMDLKRIFLELKEEGKTLLIVSHAIEPLYADTDNLIAIRKGRIIHSGGKGSTALVLEHTFNMKFERILHKKKELFIPNEDRD